MVIKIVSFFILFLFSFLLAGEGEVGGEEYKNLHFIINNLWVLIAALLVFVMHLGFACIESGLTRAKNTVNILFKNISIIAIGLLSYTVIGYGLMYPGDAWAWGKYLGFAGWGVSSINANLPNDGDFSYWTDFLFQGMFAATAATIVSGAVAERIKLNSFLVFSAIFLLFIYPVLGSWQWGGGWLNEMGFYDFAGSTLVHSVGGWAALAGVLLLGPRIGKYSQGHVRAIPGHSMPLASIGCFLLWFGWYGFNGGSVLSADPQAISYVCVTTTIAAAAGVMGGMVMSKILQGKPDLSMLLNGALAGLVSITAGADSVTVMSAAIMGLIGGMLVVVSVIILDTKFRIDDPVGAISVHLVCGIWGTLAVGIFSFKDEHSFGIQLMGVIAYALVAFLSSLIILTVIKKVMEIRPTPQEEMNGLDISEHGIEAYPSFQIYSND